MNTWFSSLNGQPAHWLVTGGAGFIGSHLVQHLLAAGQSVVVLDNFSTGHRENLLGLDKTPPKTGKFRLVTADINDRDAVADAMQGVDYVLHQAALGSVPRSIKSPMDSFANNVAGFFEVIIAAKDAGVKKFVYASSSSVYGDHPDLPKLEDKVGNPLSPYAATKAADELFADVVARTYGLPCIGLRYFNVFGPRQDPNGPYAAVIPVWMNALINQGEVNINGDGETTRDFCFVDNAVQANLLSALSKAEEGSHAALNVAYGDQTTLTGLFEMIQQRLVVSVPAAANVKPNYREFRAGDVRHSLADISRAQQLIGYKPSHDISQGMDETVAWYLASQST